MNIFSDLFLLERIDYLIRTKGTGSPKAFSSRLGISECSVYRLIERLKDMGLPIVYDKNAQTYCYIDAVQWNVEFVVGAEKIISMKGGNKN